MHETTSARETNKNGDVSAVCFQSFTPHVNLSDGHIILSFSFFETFLSRSSSRDMQRLWKQPSRSYLCVCARFLGWRFWTQPSWLHFCVCLCLLRWLPGHVLWLFWGEMGGGVGRSIRSRVKLCLQIRHSSLFQYLAAVGGPLERALPFNTSRLQSAAVSLVVAVYHLICFRFLHKLVLASASQGMASYRSFLSRNHVCTSLLTAEGGAPL